MSRKLWFVAGALVATVLLVAIAGGFLEPQGKSSPQDDAPAARAAEPTAPASEPAIAEIATSSGRAAADGDGSLGGSGESASLDPLDFEVEGRVVDAKKNPIDGALVKLVVANAPIPSPSAVEVFRNAGLVADEQRKRTGRDGRFRFRGVFLEGGGVLVAASAKGFAPAARHDLVVEAGVRTPVGDLVLTQGGALAGRILDSAGNPAKSAHAGVVATPTAGAAERFLNLSEPELFNDADEQGQFQIENLPDGRYSVIAWAPGLARGASAPVVISRESTATPTVELSLAPGDTIAGSVSSTDGTSLSEVRVRAKLKPVESDDGNVSYELPISTNSDAAGGFVLEGLVAGRQYQISASLKGYRDEATAVGAGATGLRLTLRPDLKVRGVVIDAETKQPIAGARVAVTRGKSDELSGADVLVARAGSPADSRGRFLVGDPGKPGAARVLAWARGYAPGISEPIALTDKGNAPETVVALERGGTIAGRVVAGADRTPIAGASVALFVPGKGKAPVPELLDRVTSSSDGRYEFAGLAPGGYVVEARQIAYGTGHTDLTVLAKGDRRDPFDVSLPAASTIRGVVLTGGAEISTRVTAVRDDGHVLNAYPDSQARFSFTRLGPGTYSLRAEKLLSLDDALVSEIRPPPRRAAGAGWTTVEVPEGRVVDVTLEVLGAETGKVVGVVTNDGHPGSGYSLVLARDGGNLPKASSGNPVFGQHRVATADVGGSFEFPSVAPGIYRIYAIPRGRSTSPKNAVAADTVQVLANASARRDLIGRSGPLRGRVTRANGAAVSGAKVLAVVNGTRSAALVVPGGTSFSAKSGGNGGFDFGRLPAGAYDVIVEAPGTQKKTVGADVDSGYSEPLAIVLEPVAPPAKKPNR